MIEKLQITHLLWTVLVFLLKVCFLGRKFWFQGILYSSVDILYDKDIVKFCLTENRFLQESMRNRKNTFLYSLTLSIDRYRRYSVRYPWWAISTEPDIGTYRTEVGSVWRFIGWNFLPISGIRHSNLCPCLVLVIVHVWVRVHVHRTFHIYVRKIASSFPGFSPYAHQSHVPAPQWFLVMCSGHTTISTCRTATWFPVSSTRRTKPPKVTRSAVVPVLEQMCVSFCSPLFAYRGRGRSLLNTNFEKIVFFCKMDFVNGFLC